MYLMIYFLQNIGRMAMKFKTRLLITFLTIILLPIILAVTAFLIIGGYLSKGQEDLGLRINNYNVWIDPAETSRHLSDEIFVEIREGLKQDSHLLEKTDILDAINDDIADKSSYLIVRKGNELYYAGNQPASAQIFDKLPEFNEEDIDSETAQSIYYDDMNKLVRQMDFYFTDGSEGSLFVVMKVNSTMSRKLFIDMAVAILIILVFTSLFLTKWISRSVFEPINELNVAMQNIAEGNLEYMLPHKDDGEIGDLYRNYEDMRLRLKESADEKILTEKQNKELVSNISHDLKTPITVIQGYAKGVADGLTDEDMQKQYLNTIVKKAESLTDMINTFHDYSKLEHPEFCLVRETQDLAEYLREYLAEKYDEIDLGGFNLEVEIPEETVSYSFDRVQMKRVFDNIISNSLRHNPSGTVIYVTLQQSDKAVRIEIGDSGVGIPLELQDTLFDPFIVGDESRNTRQGSGLGLAVAHKIIELHGGALFLEKGEQHGNSISTLFVIRLLK